MPYAAAWRCLYRSGSKAAACLVSHHVELAGQPTAGPSQGVVGGFGGARPAGRLLLRAAGSFLAPAACWCACAVPESTETSQVTWLAASARVCSAARISRQVPSRCQQRN
jgi:hypothetical protein